MTALSVLYRCLGKPPQQPPCGVDIASDKAAEDHVAATHHSVVSGISGAVLDRAVARFAADVQEAS